MNAPVVQLHAQAPERYLTRAELATIMGVSERTIDRWTKQHMPSELWGKRTRRFLLSEVVRWARRHGIEAGRAA